MWAIKTFGSKLHARRAAKRINDHRIDAIRKTGGGSIHGAASVKLSYIPLSEHGFSLVWDVMIPTSKSELGSKAVKSLRRIMLGAYAA